MRQLATMKRVAITVAALGRLELNAVGNAIFVESAGSDLSARADSVGEGQTVGDGLLIRAAAKYKFNALYDRIVFSNANAGAVAAIVWVGEGDFELNITS